VAQDFSIRPMRPEDLEAIYDITWRGWDEVSLRHLIEKRHGPLGEENWRDWKAREVTEGCRARPEKVLVAEVDGKVVGYATYMHSPGDPCGHVGNNCVDPDYRGRGIGSALNQAVLDKLRELGCTVLVVVTMEHDVAARRVYEKNGFVEICRSVTYTMPATPEPAEDDGDQ